MRVPGIPFVQGRNNYTDGDGLHFGIAIHNTSNNASDEGEASYAARRTDGISSHLYADKDSVTQSLDLRDRAGHAGSSHGNNNAIAVEITGSNGWTRQQWLTNVAWDKLGATLAWIIANDPDYRGFQVRRASVAEMQANPKVKAFYGHDDMRRAWGGTTHTDPGPNFPWDRLFGAVNAALGSNREDDDMPATFTDRVVKDWGGALGALYTWRPQVDATLKTILDAINGDLDTEQILARIDQRAAELRAGVVGDILARLPEQGPIDRDDLIAAFTAVLGSVDGATPTGG